MNGTLLIVLVRDRITEIDQQSIAQILSDPAIVAVVTETSSVAHLTDNLRAGVGGLPDKATRKKMSDLLLSMM